MKYSYRELESVVCCWRPSLHHSGLGHGGGHDTRSWLPLLWSCAKKVGVEHDLGLYGLVLHHYVPMVLLGLFVGFLSPRHKWVHR